MNIKMIKSKGSITFFPYSSQIFLGVLLFLIIIGHLMIVFFITNIFMKCLSALMIPFVISVGHYCVSLIQLQVTINQEGIMLFNRWAKNSWYARWESFAAAYWTYSHKGRGSLLLVTHPMEKEERNQMIAALSVIIQGRRILAIEGNTFFLADMVRREITAMIDGKFPIFDERKQDK